MEQWGNARANQYWEANLPSHVKKPCADDNVRIVERFIRDKYEHKKFVAASIPPPVARGCDPVPVVAASRPPAPRQQASESTRAPAPVPVPVAPTPAPDLLDFDFAPTAPIPSSNPVAVHDQLQSVPQNIFGFGQQHSGSQSSDGFGEFNDHRHSAPSQFVAPHHQVCIVI